MPTSRRPTSRTKRASTTAASPHPPLAERTAGLPQLSAETTPDEPGETPNPEPNPEPDPEPEPEETPAAPGESPAPASHPGTTPSEPGDPPENAARERNRWLSVDRGAMAALSPLSPPDGNV